MRKHAEVLRNFPALRQELGSIEGTARALGQRRAQAEAWLSRIQQSVMARELRRVSSGNATPYDLIDRALTSPRHMAELRRAMARAEHPDLGRTGLARVAVQRILSKPDPLAFIEQNRKAFDQLARMLAPGDPERMVRVLKAMQRT